MPLPRTVAGIAAMVLAPLLIAQPASARVAEPRPPVQLTLPAPTGPHPLGTVSLHLVDRSRPDPLAGGQTPRELMVTLTYPARRTAGHPVAPWIEPKAGREYLRAEGLPAAAVLLPLTHGHEGAPADRRLGRLPVVLYSPGNDTPRSMNTMVVEELASRGYVVGTIGHTFDGVGQFPGGRVVASAPDGPATGALIAEQRVADTRFVLDRLAQLNRGGNPDAERRRLPAGLRGLLDLDRVGMFGHSAGGATVASAMFEDPRIKAGLSLDGPVAGPVVTAGLDRPYLLMEATKARPENIPDLATFWSHLRGWKLAVRAEGAEHATYTDLEVIIAQAAPALGLSASQVAEQIGTLAPARAVAIQRAYPLAFFDRHLRRKGHLLDRPSRRFPEVTFRP